jgi:hypothetical protein
MTSTDISVASWNIGGGILGESHQRHGLPSLNYHIEQLRTLNLDLVCLQECQSWGQGSSQVRDLADSLGYESFDYVALSSSHFDDNATLGLGIISRHPLQRLYIHKFKNPGLEATGPTGEHWLIADKGFASWGLELADGRCTILNCHCYPLHYFGADPHEPRFQYIWTDLGRALAEAQSGLPVVCLDLNSESIDDLIGRTLVDRGYQELTPRMPTTPKGLQQDYLLAGDGWECRGAGVRSTLADHHLLWARVSRDRTVTS